MRFSFAEIIGVIASILTGISLLPQLINLLRNKTAEGLSPVMLCVLFGGLLSWVIYGWKKQDLIIVISNLFSWTVNLLLILLYIRYHKKDNS